MTDKLIDGYDYSVLQSAKDVKLTPFVHSLVSVDERIKIFPFADEFKPNTKDIQAYVPRKDIIAIPWEIPQIEHEIAHMVEMNNISRVLQIDWGLKIFGSFIPSNNQFFAALSREIRVRSIQKIMGNPPYWVSMLDHPYWGEAKQRLPYGKFKDVRDLSRWISDLDEKTSKAWSLDRIQTEWNRKLDYLRNWMETSNG